MHVNKEIFHEGSAINSKCQNESIKGPEILLKSLRAEISVRGIIGPYFFEDGRVQTITVDTERYVAMTFWYQNYKTFLIITREHCFEQDGKISHKSNTSLQRVHEIFHSKLIYRRGVINWPPSSSDFSLKHLFLCDI